jgi:hypothetical protein
MMEDVDILETCIEADEAHARWVADKHHRAGDVEQAAILRRAADDLRHILHDLRRGFSEPETVELLGAVVAVGGEG